jgi:hypothetical protein
VKTAIDGLLPNQPNGNPDYLQSGADNTLRGIAVLNALRGADADNPLSRAWANLSADPLVGPVVAHQPNAANPDLGFEYDTVRSLFLTPEASRRFIAALDRGAALAEGDPQPQANGSRQAGFYVSGDDFVHWNRNGQGQAFIDGHWRRIDPDNLTHVRNDDGTTELMINEDGRRATLLRVDPRAPDLRSDVTTAPGAIDYVMNERDTEFAVLRHRPESGYSEESRVAGPHLHQDKSSGPEYQGSVSAPAMPFGNPYLNRMLAAVTAGDEAGASRIAQEFVQSPQGVAFVHRGEQLLAQQQGEEREDRQPSAGQRQSGEFERG